jgi:hypothetical protein
VVLAEHSRRRTGREDFRQVGEVLAQAGLFRVRPMLAMGAARKLYARYLGLHPVRTSRDGPEAHPLPFEPDDLYALFWESFTRQYLMWRTEGGEPADARLEQEIEDEQGARRQQAEAFMQARRAAFRGP